MTYGVLGRDEKNLNMSKYIHQFHSILYLFDCFHLDKAHLNHYAFIESLYMFEYALP